MAKTITIQYEGTEYTLEFTRKSIEQMERQGFVIDDIKSKPMTTLPSLFAGAFLAHHRFAKKDTIDAIFERLSDKEEFLGKLAEMYVEPLEALMGESGEPEGNVTWGASW